jgi:hypothetical protein
MTSCRRKLARPNSHASRTSRTRFEHGWRIREIYRLSTIDPWFLDQLQQVMEIQREVESRTAAVAGEPRREQILDRSSFKEAALLIGVSRI